MRKTLNEIYDLNFKRCNPNWDKCRKWNSRRKIYYYYSFVEAKLYKRACERLLILEWFFFSQNSSPCRNHGKRSKYYSSSLLFSLCSDAEHRIHLADARQCDVITSSLCCLFDLWLASRTHQLVVSVHRINSRRQLVQICRKHTQVEFQLLRRTHKVMVNFYSQQGSSRNFSRFLIWWKVSGSRSLIQLWVKCKRSLSRDVQFALSIRWKSIFSFNARQKLQPVRFADNTSHKTTIITMITSSHFVTRFSRSAVIRLVGTHVHKLDLLFRHSFRRSKKKIDLDVIVKNEGREIEKKKPFLISLQIYELVYPSSPNSNI